MNIGLIAMSGIRVVDAELLELGLTLPGFVERSNIIASLPSLGLLTLAGMIPKEHSVKYIEDHQISEGEEFNNLIIGFDLIAISSFSAQIKEAYELSDKIMALKVPVILGGLHVTCLPEEAKEHCDAVLIGEGELHWLDILKDAQVGKLKDFYGSVDEEYDLKDSPMPAFELLDIEKYNRLTIQTSRGCPHSCEFCASSILITKKYKQKPIDKVLAEIDKIKTIWEHPMIELAEDNTFVNKEYWKELLPQLKERKIRWFTETDISLADDESLLKSLSESGCAQVLIGFESPEVGSLDGIETKNNWKSKQFTKYKEAITKIQSYGISVNGCFILGLDDQDKNIFDAVFNFVKETGLHEVQITIQTAFPGTPLYERLEKENRIIDKGAWEKCTLFDVNFIPKKMTSEELRNGFRNLGLKLYSDEFTKYRKENFKKILRGIIKEKRRMK
ncbi:MAG: B12-binding domain-containing radical SAM protein [Candidatus Delongbacteria bacterium]|nr:B12-binding domain-containing radical SAM protein [Candidatus Delongbacteria bacterium]